MEWKRDGCVDFSPKERRETESLKMNTENLCECVCMCVCVCVCVCVCMCACVHVCGNEEKWKQLIFYCISTQYTNYM